MQRLEDSGAVRPIYGSLGVKRLIKERAQYRGEGNQALGTTFASILAGRARIINE